MTPDLDRLLEIQKEHAIIMRKIEWATMKNEPITALQEQLTNIINEEKPLKSKLESKLALSENKIKGDKTLFANIPISPPPETPNPKLTHAEDSHRLLTLPVVDCVCWICNLKRENQTLNQELAQAERKQNKPVFDIEIGREPIFALDGDYDQANYRLVSDIYETESDVLKAKKNLENITKLYEDNNEFFTELQKKIDVWESNTKELTQLRPIVETLKNNKDVKFLLWKDGESIDYKDAWSFYKTVRVILKPYKSILATSEDRK
jgi:hypothetical protein